MKRKLLLLLILIISIALVIFTLKPFNKKEELNTDSIKFKEEYEKLNDKVNERNNKKYPKVIIPEDNPFIYSDTKDIIKRINNNETIVIYFGFNTCPWCRSVLPTLMEASEYLEVDKIYYIDISDIRNTMTINSDNEIETTKEGTEGYYELLEVLDDVLEDYTLIDKDDNKVSTGEKRIYAPNIVTVVEGEVIALETGISDKQTDGYMKLTEEIKKDSYDKLYKILDDFKTRESMCGVNSNSGC